VGDTSYSLGNAVGQYINFQSEDDIAAEMVVISEGLGGNVSSSRGSSQTSATVASTGGGGQPFLARSLIMDGNESGSDVEGDDGDAGGHIKRQRLEVAAEDTASVASPGGSQGGRSPLTPDDFIVEKMHIHYGTRAANPVANLRFYTKTIRRDGRPIGRAVDTEQMAAAPRDFEVFKLRVFCKSPNVHKESLIRQCFELYCSEHHVSTPFPSSSQG